MASRRCVTGKFFFFRFFFLHFFLRLISAYLLCTPADAICYSGCVDGFGFIGGACVQAVQTCGADVRILFRASFPLRASILTGRSSRRVAVFSMVFIHAPITSAQPSAPQVTRFRAINVSTQQSTQIIVVQYVLDHRFPSIPEFL